VDFAEGERRFYELKGRLDAGLITPAAFEAAARQLTVRDAAGRLWTMGARTGKWYYAAGGKWVEAQPPVEASAPQPIAGPGPASAVPSPVPTASFPAISDPRPRGSGPGTGKLALPLLAAGCLGLMVLLAAGALAAALFLPGSPWQILPQSPAADAATPGAPQTPVAVTPASVEPSVTPVVIVVTATPQPLASTPTAPAVTPVTATPAVPASPAATVTPTRSLTATIQPTVTIQPTPTPTATVPAPTATTAPVAPGPLSVTLINPHYERWGRPADNTGCFYYNNGSPVRRFAMQIVLKNNTAAAISDWAKPSFYANTGATLVRCYGSSPTDTTLPPVPANSTATVTFFSFTDEGTWVSRVDFVYRDRTWRWTLDTNAQVIAGP
jgi:hypothetical protein